MLIESVEYAEDNLHLFLDIRAFKLDDGFVALWRDATDRRSMEQALKDSERRFRAIFESMFQFIGLMKPDGTILEINRTALDFAGLKREDAVGRPLWEIMWWDAAAEGQNKLKDAIKRAARGEFIRYEVDVPGVKDNVATIDFSIKPIKDETGAVVLLIPEGRDITRRKLAEEALRLSEERFSKTFNASSTLMSIKRLSDWRYIDVNMVFIRTTGYSREEIIGQTPIELNIWPDPESWLAMINKLQQEGSIYNEESLFRGRCRRPFALPDPGGPNGPFRRKNRREF